MGKRMQTKQHGNSVLSKRGGHQTLSKRKAQARHGELGHPRPNQPGQEDVARPSTKHLLPGQFGRFPPGKSLMENSNSAS
jgi:hypothetical protein